MEADECYKLNVAALLHSLPNCLQAQAPLPLRTEVAEGHHASQTSIGHRLPASVADNVSVDSPACAGECDVSESGHVTQVECNMNRSIRTLQHLHPSHYISGILIHATLAPTRC